MDTGLGQGMRSAVARLLFRSWFDRAALAALGDWIFPASRLWAAAETADYDLSRFCAHQPDMCRGITHLVWLPHVLGSLRTLKLRAIEAERRWDELFFGGKACPDVDLVAAEAQRLRSGRTFLGSRLMFAPAARAARVDAVAWDIPHAAASAGAIARADEMFRPPDPWPPVEVSARARTRASIEYALRFALPGAVDGAAAFARVSEPPGIADPPTVIHCHGFGVEAEHLDRMFDEMRPLVSAGVRVVRMILPWHGRRRRPGTWSGEPFLAQAPLSCGALFETAVRELGVLVGWARSTSRGRVALSGVSLGALTAQLAAVRLGAWPKTCWPDALLLIGTSDRLDRIAFDGALARVLGLDRALRARGWTREALTALGALANPVGTPVVDPARILMVLGTVDDVTPFDGGVELARHWHVPAANQFHRPQGHFSVSLGLIGEDAPLRRLAALLRGRG
ncbi:MAG TPA: hypothetical protein VF342_04550 [Alphaproteobacteria bacterium]